MATMPTRTSEASRRGEGKEIGTVDVIMVKFATGFGTATLPSCTSEPSQCGEPPADRSKNGNLPML